MASDVPTSNAAKFGKPAKKRRHDRRTSHPSFDGLAKFRGEQLKRVKKKLDTWGHRIVARQLHHVRGSRETIRSENGAAFDADRMLSGFQGVPRSCDMEIRK